MTETRPAAKMTPNGPGAAAVFAAGIGSCAIGIVAVLADRLPAVARLLNFYRPTGPLSGVTTVSIFVWLAAWALLHYLWNWRNVDLRRVVTFSFILLFIGLLLTFPPIGNLF